MFYIEMAHTPRLKEILINFPTKIFIYVITESPANGTTHDSRRNRLIMELNMLINYFVTSPLKHLAIYSFFPPTSSYGMQWPHNLD